MPYIIYAGLECLVKKIDGCGIILKHLQQQKEVSIFLTDIQYQIFLDLII